MRNASRVPSPAPLHATWGHDAAGAHVRALDGLRAVAVALVMLFHLRVPGFGAGFLGVDVFFVLSGFLITSLLLVEHERSGRISLGQFWARRAGRLLPAVVVLLVAVAVWAGVAATLSERAATRGDLIATTGYVANWRLISSSSYFADVGIDSPLEHTWSLAIEEQFYLVWPLLVVALFRLGRRARLSIGVLASVLAGASAVLLFRLWEPGAVERAYMGTDARIFEPLIGALGAVLVASPVVRPVVERTGKFLAALGALLLLGCVVIIEPGGQGYFAGGALSVAFASLLIVGPMWVGAGGQLSSVLSWRPLVWLGAVSYGVYLWHWPFALLSGARDASGMDHALRALVAAALTLAVAGASHRFVERPIMDRLKAQRSGTRRTRARSLRVSLAAVPLALLTVACVSVAMTEVPPPPPGVPVVLVVGDSVPLHLAPTLERAADRRGWRLVSAAHGACPVTGETPADPGGQAMRSGGACASEVVPDQRALVAETDPDAVLWWDRFSVSGFLTGDGAYARPGTARFWRLREEGLDRAVDRLSSDGAKVMLVATEPPGLGATERIAQGCSNCEWWIPFQVEHYDDVTVQWNEMMSRYAAEHPEVATFTSITGLVCMDDRVPCNDTIDGAPARVDGTHYGSEGGQMVARALLDQMVPLLEASATVSPEAQAVEASQAPVSGRRANVPKIMLVGDSVPRNLRFALRARVKEVMGWRVVEAAHAACAVSAETVAWVDGSPRGDPGRCPNEVQPAQDDLIANAQPEVVVWWDRFSVTHFLMPGGEFVRSGSDRFWELRAAALQATVDRLTVGGAKIVFVATEPIGRGWVSRCPDRNEWNCRTWLRFQIAHFEDITQRWNQMMRDYALANPDVAAYVRITDEICTRIEAPCNDKIRHHGYSRPDGTHYEGRGEKKAANALVREIRWALSL